MSDLFLFCFQPGKPPEAARKTAREFYQLRGLEILSCLVSRQVRWKMTRVITRKMGLN